MELTTELVDALRVRVFATRQAMGEAAGKDVVAKIQVLLREKERIRMIFAAAPSQNELLDYLASVESMDWSRIEVFHMDEYVGLPANVPERFSSFLKKRLFDRVKPYRTHLIDDQPSVKVTLRKYAHLLTEAPIDIVCLGIGENGHLAFNDPPVADFNDPQIIKVVELDSICRQQQVNDGCFPSLDAVPKEALTLTIPALLSGSHLFCVVPGVTKQQAVKAVLNDAIHTNCPATILRKHPDCTLYVDQDSYGAIA